MRVPLLMPGVRSTVLLVAVVSSLTWAGLRPVGLAARSGPEADRILAALEATSTRESRLVESFATSKTFTVMHEGQICAEVVAALQFTSPDVKVFSILESRGSDFLRDHVINRMMQTEVDLAQPSGRSRAAINPDNYTFGMPLDDGDAVVVEMVPRRQGDLLFKGRIWITKDGSHLKRIEGEPATSPSFWTRRIQFVTEYAPVDGVWLHVRTEARVTMRWFGEYLVRSECGPYQVRLVPQTVVSRF
jgi:hypothetical protein